MPDNDGAGDKDISEGNDAARNICDDNDGGENICDDNDGERIFVMIMTGG